ncbi:MAG: transporter substrate-binding domain-containing protein [Faecousia sp.]
MKKVFAIALTALLLVGMLAGCSGSGKEKEVLTVALSPDFAPMEFVDATKTGQDKYVGFDVSLAKFIADELGMELEIKPMSFDACQTAVGLGNVDMSISGFSWTEDRAENYNLSDYYWAGDNESEQTLITLAENAGKYTTAESLAGLKVGAQTASLQESLCKEQLPDCELVVVADLTTALMQLRNGDFDVLAVAKGNGDAIIASNTDIALSGFYFEVDEKYTGNVILLNKESDELTAKVNELLAKAEAAGYYTTWYDEAKAIAGIEVSYDDAGNELS